MDNNKKPKPKFKIGDIFVSSEKGDVVITKCQFSELTGNFSYEFEYNYRGKKLCGSRSEKEILRLLGELPPDE